MLCSVETFKSDSSLTCLILALNVDTLTSQQQSTWYENEENLESSSASEIGENSVGGSASSGGVNSTDSSVNSMSKYRVSVSLITWGLNGGGTWNCFGTVRSARYAVWRNRIGQIFSGETMIERKDLSKCQSRNQFQSRVITVASQKLYCYFTFPYLISGISSEKEHTCSQSTFWFTLL